MSSAQRSPAAPSSALGGPLSPTAGLPNDDDGEGDEMGSVDDEDFDVRPPLVIDALTPAQVETLKDLFTVFDQQGQGFLHPSELRVALRMADCEVSRDEAHAFTASFCLDRERGFTLEEFLAVVDHVVASRPPDFRRRYLESTFDALDADGAGDLDANQIGKWAALVKETEASSDAAPSATERTDWSRVHVAPDYLQLEPLDRELSKPGGIDKFMRDLGLDPSSRISRETFVELFLGSETIV